MSVLEVASATTEATRIDAGPFAISDIAFDRDTILPRHEHPRACLAVVVAGGVRKQYGRTTHEAGRATIVSMPAREPHADVFGTRGARIVVVEGTDVADRTEAVVNWGAAAVAHRLRGELSAPDEFSPLALESLALELVVLSRRAVRADDRARWADDAAEILRERFRTPPSARELADELGVHPAHLARSFRARHGESLGSYVRNVRLDWAAARVVHSDAPLARVACETGFADQSHFTRLFAARFGVPPGRYRAAHR